MIDPREDNAEFEHVMAAMDKADISNGAKLRMFKERRFGIDWDVGPTAAPEALDERDWDVSMDRMHELCRDGGLVFMPCRNTEGVEAGLLGQVVAPADIEIRDYEEQSGAKEVSMKTLKMRGVREVHPDDDTEVFEIQYGRPTVHNINEYRDKVVEAYERRY